MAAVAFDKYGLTLTDNHLPMGSLDQGLDVLQIMRNIDVFVRRYNYNLNQQFFVVRGGRRSHSRCSCSPRNPRPSAADAGEEEPGRREACQHRHDLLHQRLHPAARERHDEHDGELRLPVPLAALHALLAGAWEEGEGGQPGLRFISP